MEEDYKAADENIKYCKIFQIISCGYVVMVALL